jgi:hypothetical protein
MYYADIYDKDYEFCSWDSNGNSIFGEYNWEGRYDKVDLYPDINIGRLACTSTSQVSTCVNKIKTYEINKAYTQDWFTDMVVIGGDTWVPDHGDDSGIDEGELINQEIIDVMTGFIPKKIWATNGLLGKVLPPFGVGEIKSAINPGCGFVEWSGHGDHDLWGTHPHESGKWIWIPTPTPPGFFSRSDVNSLSNGDELPIVVIGGCSCGNFDKDSSCFAWSWMSNSNGGGIAVAASSGLLYSYLGGGTTNGLAGKIEINMHKAYRTWGALTFGEMWNKAITDYIFPSMRDVDIKTMEQWTSFGDPTLAIGEQSDPPNKPSKPNGPSSGVIGEEYTYTSSTTDPNGDEIYYQFDWNDGTSSGWIGPQNSGTQASADKTWTKQGTYQVKVVAKDEHHVISEWSDTLTVTIPRSRSAGINSDGTFTAEMGISRDSDPDFLLDGDYKERGRFKVAWGTATARERQGRFFGIFTDNYFIIKVPTQRLTIRLLGRYREVNQEISGIWISRIPYTRGWINGEFISS